MMKTELEGSLNRQKEGMDSVEEGDVSRAAAQHCATWLWPRPGRTINDTTPFRAFSHFYIALI
jgi:hypothetical protein